MIGSSMLLHAAGRLGGALGGLGLLAPLSPLLASSATLPASSAVNPVSSAALPVSCAALPAASAALPVSSAALRASRAALPAASAVPSPAFQASSLPRSVRDALGPLFEKANANPAGVVPLILRASAALESGGVDTDPTVDRKTGRLTGDAPQKDSLSREDFRLLADTLEPYCRRVFFSPERLPGMQKLGVLTHVVKAGEVPEKIAKKYRIGSDLLAYLNKDFDPRKLKEGEELKVVDVSGKQLELDVEKSLFRVGAWRQLENGSRALMMYAPVGLGAAESPTPEGRTTITLRVRNPEWTDPVTKEVYKPGDPRNVLGGYWIALDAAGIGKSGIGFHGFTGEPSPNWIGQPESHGCVRMLQGDVDRLYGLALEGTSVEIRP